jgi:hypothetical protein
MDSLRIGTTHASTDTGGTGFTDLHLLTQYTSYDNENYKYMPAVYLGDFNAHPNNYPSVKSVFSFPNTDLHAAVDCWKFLYGGDANADGRTIDMRYNALDQFFSTQRDTAGPSIIDYIWAKPGTQVTLEPKSVTIPRDWAYTSSNWYWAHPTHSDRNASVAISGDSMCVLTHTDGDKGERDDIQYSVFDKKEQKWKHGDTGSTCIGSPGVVAFGGKFHMFYRATGSEQAIFHRSSANGINWGNAENTGLQTGGSVCPIVFQDKLYLFHVDSGGIGGQIRFVVKERNDDNWAGRSQWGTLRYIGINTHSDISAAVSGTTLCVVSKEGSSGSGGVMRSVRLADDKWDATRCSDKGGKNGISSSGAPSIIGSHHGFMLVYRDPKGNAAYSAESIDGLEWKNKDRNLGHGLLKDAVTAIPWEGKIMLFYGFNDINVLGNNFKDGTMIHTIIPDTKVDLSDHYPMLADIEMRKRTIMVNISAHISGIGDLLYTDGQWAGTKAEGRAIEGFQLNPQISGLTLRYKVRIKDKGETDWVSDGKFAGIKGESKMIEGFTIELTGDSVNKYKLSYKAHIEGAGDTEFLSAGNYCGTTNGKRVEAIWIRLENK